MHSKFRKLQNQEIETFAALCNGFTVYELGGTYSENSKIYFKEVKNFIITNILEGECDEIQDVTKLTFQNNSIDNIICISVLQHVFNYDKAINEIIRVLKPGGRALITNGYLFPICMEEDYFRFTPKFWEVRLEKEAVKFTVKKLGNRYSTIENLLMRPYNSTGGILGLLNKSLAQIFRILGVVNKNKDAYPLGVAVYLEKNK